MILGDESLLDLGELRDAFIEPIVLASANMLKNVLQLTKDISADDAGTALLLGDLFQGFTLDPISEFGRNFPIGWHDWLTVGLEVTYFQEVESSIFILQKVAHKVVQTTFFLRVDVGLCEHFIDSVNGCDRALIRVRHAFDFDAAFFVLHVHREQILQVQDAESIMDLIHEGVVDEFGVFATCAFTLFLGLLPHFLHLNVL